MFYTSYKISFLELVQHPVLASLIALKWKKVQKYFAIQSGIFLAFVLFYSFFLIYLFNQEKKPEPTIYIMDNNILMAKFHQPFVICELVLVLLTAFLIFFDLYQV